MWTHEESVEVAAAPEQLWKLFSDVAGWKKWNNGIEHIELHGAFVEGATFSMQPPNQEAFTSTLISVRENESFTDETTIEGTCVVVHHRLVPLAANRTKVVYRTEITGSAAEDFGPLVTADFPDVLGALKALAEAATVAVA